MATCHYHPTDPGCNLTADAKAFVASMIADGLRQQTHADCIFMVEEPDATGWRKVHIDAVEELLAATAGMKEPAQPIATYTVYGSPGINISSVWLWYESIAPSQSDSWRFEFLAAFTSDRMTIHEALAVMRGQYRVELAVTQMVLHVLKAEG